MNTKLILIEGLPGSGKSTIAHMVFDIFADRGVEAQLFQEGNVDHPADYEGVSFYRQEEFHQLLLELEESRDMLANTSLSYGNDYLIPYRKIQHELGTDFPVELLHALFKKDIYELPFYENVRLITERWKSFVKDALQDDTIHIFECCFIQNPLTIGTVKYNVRQSEVMDYVFQLEELIKPLNPLLIYIDKQDIRSVFEKAVHERPQEWANGFMEYYTGQGFGQMQGYSGFDGTVQVLQERKKIELEIYDLLKINKQKIDNSQYDLATCKEKIKEILGKEIST
ncbi:hypothetical protein [Paenibacillus lemnae]|uniref:Adenylyl-sulfate kinase n=1 Tax=Paenibacillus lemnae TaxID=1330551 RepID=A0A848M9G3_PAELE|nr:hypothetical protein [Paenibacillus lemnae]NMO97697.1 hypothetical protein [Paenibacillus lemnae]